MLACAASCSQGRTGDAVTQQPLGSLDPAHMMRLLAACEFSPSVTRKRSVLCSQRRNLDKLLPEETSADGKGPGWVTQDEADGNVKTIWAVHTTFNGRVNAIDLRAPTAAALIDEADRILSAIDAPAADVLLATIESSAGPRNGQDTVPFQGIEIKILRDFLGHVGSTPVDLGIRWTVGIGL